MDQKRAVARPGEERCAGTNAGTSGDSTPPSGRPWLARLLLVGLLLFLLGQAWFAPHTEPITERSLVDLQKTAELLDWVGEWATHAALVFARSLLLGVLIPLSLAADRLRRSSLRHALLSLVTAWGVATLLAAVEAGKSPTPLQLLLPWSGCLAGVWTGVMWRLGGWARGSLILQALLLVVLIPVGGAVLIHWAVEEQPLPFKPAEVTSAEKRRLMQLVRESYHRAQPDAETWQLELSELDLDLLLNWGLSIGSSDRKAKVRLHEGEAVLLASARLPVAGLEDRYLNLRIGGPVTVEEGELRLQVEQLQVGRIAVPDWLVGPFSPAILSAMDDVPEIQEVLESVESLDITPGQLRVLGRRDELNGEMLPTLISRLGGNPDVLEATRVQIRHLVSVADQLPRGDERFLGFLQAAFQLARDRTAAGGDPTLENRAAIYALAVLLGHPRVESLIGPLTDGDVWVEARRRIGPVTIRGRADWTRHFCVSAALALLSNEAVSDAIGLLKEELDAGRGGSGFSFADLLADHAGTQFALAATRDRASALSLQQQFSGEIELDELFPPAADLPEGLSDEELETQYGGIGGQEYRRLLQEIERRLAGCALLH